MMKFRPGLSSLAIALLASPVVACGDGGCSSERASSSEPSLEESEIFPEGDPPLPGVSQTNGALAKKLAAALQKKGPNYKPRTHHLRANGQPKFTNRLILETSPYLLQHAHNPVNWRAWSEETFERAKKENKPILLSVGYSTCHWCHVMERESFEDEEIAAFINKHFIAIKVDREERPDIDDIYMRAVRVLSGRGGWPMTVIMTPDKDPFFGGTYIPARDGDRGSRQGFLTLLRQTSEEFQKEPTELISKAQETSQKVMAAAAPLRPGAVPAEASLNRAAQVYLQRFDRAWGGFGRAPKFPRPANLDFLLRHYRVLKESNKTEADELLRAVLVTLDKMATGGLFDQVGGGFHRYSTDTRWLVPHFEKMLYDNGQLTAVYLDAYQITGNEFYSTIATRTLDYVLREMTSPEGASYSATDADSLVPSGHMEEGYFFTWTPAELQTALSGDELRAVTAYYSVVPQGNFEGRNIFHVARPLAAVAQQLSLNEVELEGQLESARRKLYDAREQRPAPGLDDKILTSWNGLMISGMCAAGAQRRRS